MTIGQSDGRCATESPTVKGKGQKSRRLLSYHHRMPDAPRGRIVDPSSQRVEVVTGAALDALFRISISAMTGDGPPIAEITGDDVGTTWLHLLGWAIELPEPRNVEQLRSTIVASDPDAFELQLLGIDEPDADREADRGLIAAAQTRNPEAIEQLLATPRYFAGFARPALAGVLSTPRGSRRDAYLGALEEWLAEATPWDERTALEAAERATALVTARPLAEALTTLTGGYNASPTPEIDRVVLVPQVTDRPFFVVMSHGTTQIVVFPGATLPDREFVERVATALSDPSRLDLVVHVASGLSTTAELMEATGLSRSTTHHHLTHLRVAGIVTVGGSNRRFRWLIRPGLGAAIGSALGRLVGEDGK